MPYLKVDAGKMRGEIRVPYSKSFAHRLLVCSFLAGELLDIPCEAEDITATTECLRALREGKTVLNCRESGTTLRFMKSICRALGIKAQFQAYGNLGKRPISELDEVLDAHTVDGKLEAGIYEISGDISSQYISGLLMALPVLSGNSKIVIKGKITSGPYITLTTNIMRLFGVKTVFDEETMIFMVPGNQKYTLPANPLSYLEGDWSSAAMWMVASYLRSGEIKVNGIDTTSWQADSRILDILEIENGLDAEISINDCPDLAPAIALWAVCRDGQTAITDTERLKIKESDRQLAIVFILKQLGADIKLRKNTIIITGTAGKKLPGSKQLIDTRNDHRMVMLAALTSIVTELPVNIDNPFAVNKSYPGFFEDIEKLGGELEWN